MKRLLYLVLLLGTTALPVWAQVPTLNQFTGKNGIDKSRGANTTGVNGVVFNLDPTGSPRGVTTGSLVVLSGGWPDAPTTGNGFPHNCTSPCESVWTDNGTSNTYTRAFAVASCQDSNGQDHNIYYVLSFTPPASGTTTKITETHPDKISNSWWNIGNYYNTGTASGGSCLTGVTPANNTAPNITGTGFSVTNGDLIVGEVDDETEIGGVNSSDAFTSITVPADCKLLQENSYMGNVEFYCIATSTGTYTPTFTIAQGTHDAFTIMAQAFHSGSGGSAPGSAKGILLSAQTITAAAATYTQNVGCPTATTSLIITDDAALISSITDGGDTFTSVTEGSGSPIVYYKLSISISNQNTFVVSLVSGGGGVDEVTFYCTTVTALDTGVTAGAANNQVTTSAVEVSGTFTATPTTGGTVSGVPLLTPGQADDLFIGTGAMGTGPALSISGPSGVVNDFPSPAAINACTVTTAGVCGGDANDYTNGDGGFHFYDTASAQISFNWVGNPSQSIAAIVVGFKAAGSSAPIFRRTPEPGGRGGSRQPQHFLEDVQ